MAKPGYKPPPALPSGGGGAAGMVDARAFTGSLQGSIEFPIVDKPKDIYYPGLRLTDPEHEEPSWSWHDEVMWTTAGIIFAFSTGGFIGASLSGSSLLTQILVRTGAGIPGDIMPELIASHGNLDAARAFAMGQFWGRAGQAALDVLAITPTAEIAPEGVPEPVEALPGPIEGPDLPAEPEGSWWDYVNPVKWGEWMAEGYYGDPPVVTDIPDTNWDRELFDWLSWKAYGGATPLSPPEGGVPDVGRLPSFWEFTQEITSDFYGTPIGPAYEPGGFYSPVPAPVSPPVSVLPPGHALEDVDPTFVPFF